MDNSKPSLRKHFLSIRENIVVDVAKAAAAKAAYNFLQTVNLTDISKIALYNPIKGEISLEPLVDAIAHSSELNINFCLPVVEAKDKPLQFYSWSPGDALANNYIYPQLREPTIKNEPAIPEIIIVPLVAFDTACNRLGYGVGFYDRTIGNLKEQGKSILTVGYAYDCQKSEDTLSTEPHDIKLDFIVTDKQVYQAD